MLGPEDEKPDNTWASSIAGGFGMECSVQTESEPCKAYLPKASFQLPPSLHSILREIIQCESHEESSSLSMQIHVCAARKMEMGGTCQEFLGEEFWEDDCVVVTMRKSLFSFWVGESHTWL